MFKQLLSEGRAATLLYSVRSPHEAAFLQELTKLAQAQAGAADAGADAGGGAKEPPRAAVVATVTGSANRAWRGRRGRIDEALVREVAGGGGLAGWEVYMCGPEAFMAAMEGVLVGCPHSHRELQLLTSLGRTAPAFTQYNTVVLPYRCCCTGRYASLPLMGVGVCLKLASCLPQAVLKLLCRPLCA
jgi:NAD(P)H-flavin reductase